MYLTTAAELLAKLARHGGSIVSSNDLDTVEIAYAKRCNRMYVDEHGLGYIWKPGNTSNPLRSGEADGTSLGI